MKKVIVFSLILIWFFNSCGEDFDDNQIAKVQPTLKFSHNWNGQSITNSDFNTIQYTTENGDNLSIERLRYLISDIIFTTANGESLVINQHQLVDVTNNNGLSLIINELIPVGNYTNVTFTFGFDNEDIAENYPDLNSESFNVPEMLGGGYHYMQLDGKFINSNTQQQGFNFHAIRAVDNPGPNPTFPQDTFFTVNLGAITVTNEIEIEIEANLAEWFRNPNIWNLNELNTVLMPNSTAQIMMYENGQSVFSIGAVIQ